MTINVRLFARARDLAGQPAVEIDLPAGSTVAQLREALAARIPALRPILPQLLVAQDNEYATDETPLSSGAELACFPPVSGG